MTSHKSSISTEHASHKLVDDFKALISDAEALIKASAEHGGEAMHSVRAKAEHTLSAAKESLSEAQGVITEKAKEAAQEADVFVHEKPWQAVGIAAGAGLLIGLLISRR
ncbi:DUF883 domain-containing protein [Polynucleobacter paludilacus]|uniref:DUF883 family protein n=1 Tax=Polynucleobacter paludilacus TaxID=1855895 RepID=UPI001BFE6B0A|nr:DUF883 family protein [Polynucleobacter paludilacus]QWD45066.1 DUF883 domain-containing protein [Polynucleobacter paneuropaeus]QWD86314.1 DUF883 domain-containing protein [Polynucleobacter paludilacus]